jgi:hypothetical protein
METVLETFKRTEQNTVTLSKPHKNSTEDMGIVTEKSNPKMKYSNDCDVDEIDTNEIGINLIPNDCIHPPDINGTVRSRKSLQEFENTNNLLG